MTCRFSTRSQTLFTSWVRLYEFFFYLDTTYYQGWHKIFLNSISFLWSTYNFRTIFRTKLQQKKYTLIINFWKTGKYNISKNSWQKFTIINTPVAGITIFMILQNSWNFYDFSMYFKIPWRFQIFQTVTVAIIRYLPQ